VTKNRKRVLVALAIVGGLTLAFAAGCTEDERAPRTGENIAQDRQNYTPHNDVEGRNYNARQALADNPATLIWCTAFPTSPNARAFTVPIVGKLTSGNKRPEPISQIYVDTDNTGTWYNPDLPGPDGMYGTSGEFRYGFDPAGNYHDFYNLETYCTTVPNILQREQTLIIIGTDGDLADIDQRAEAALATCRQTDTDPSHPCEAAADILGV